MVLAGGGLVGGGWLAPQTGATFLTCRLVHTGRSVEHSCIRCITRESGRVGEWESKRGGEGEMGRWGEGKRVRGGEGRGERGREGEGEGRGERRRDQRPPAHTINQNYPIFIVFIKYIFCISESLVF